ncbi:hypothetical protein GGX14DRAFT_579229 [Mycena pura]|uniref:Uncharacterized protein n=1 Tax=Mycena pura TaxID=153505 RepID=A0AAD6UNC7_9AGAR|nr:hypothetical protein GGX14DRAFT_579229 [Mycena pura]
MFHGTALLNGAVSRARRCRHRSRAWSQARCHREWVLGGGGRSPEVRRRLVAPGAAASAVRRFGESPVRRFGDLGGVPAVRRSGESPARRFGDSEVRRFGDWGPEVACERGVPLTRGRFDDGHMRRFWALAKEPGFTGSLVPGKALEVLAARREAREAAERVARAAAMRNAREREEMEVDSSDDEECVRVRPRARSGRVRRTRQVVSSDEEDEEDEQVFVHNTASSWRRGVDEEMQQGWSDEEGDEEVESALSAKLYMLSMLATDGVEGNKED